jgi:hypothetical protein
MIFRIESRIIRIDGLCYYLCYEVVWLYAKFREGVIGPRTTAIHRFCNVISRYCTVQLVVDFLLPSDYVLLLSLLLHNVMKHITTHPRGAYEGGSKKNSVTGSTVYVE